MAITKLKDDPFKKEDGSITLPTPTIKWGDSEKPQPLGLSGTDSLTWESINYFSREK